MSRAFWFAAGAVSGVYGLVKAKRALEVFTPDGVGARVAAVRTGARLFTDQVSTKMHEREAELLAEVEATAAVDRLIAQAAAEDRTLAPRHLAPTESVTHGYR